MAQRSFTPQYCSLFSSVIDSNRYRLDRVPFGQNTRQLLCLTAPAVEVMKSVLTSDQPCLFDFCIKGHGDANAYLCTTIYTVFCTVQLLFLDLRCALDSVLSLCQGG